MIAAEILPLQNSVSLRERFSKTTLLLITPFEKQVPVGMKAIRASLT